MVNRRGFGESTELAVGLTYPIIVTIGHHRSGKCILYSSKSSTSPGCLETSFRQIRR